VSYLCGQDATNFSGFPIRTNGCLTDSNEKVMKLEPFTWDSIIFNTHLHPETVNFSDCFSNDSFQFLDFIGNFLVIDFLIYSKSQSIFLHSIFCSASDKENKTYLPETEAIFIFISNPDDLDKYILGITKFLNGFFS
jgi:hypothetical protein